MFVINGGTYFIITACVCTRWIDLIELNIVLVFFQIVREFVTRFSGERT